ncbi:MAG: hypothetical protein MI974_20330 [Chitinophagales bacterium]|nr:hypothetical protein [Chitinophagales bacterium]
MKKTRERIDKYLMTNYPAIWRSHLHMTITDPLVLTLFFAVLLLKVFIAILDQNMLLLIAQYAMPLYEIPLLSIALGLAVILILSITNLKNELFINNRQRYFHLKSHTQSEYLTENISFLIRGLIIVFLSALPLLCSYSALNRFSKSNPAMLNNKDELNKGKAVIAYHKLEQKFGSNTPSLTDSAKLKDNNLTSLNNPIILRDSLKRLADKYNISPSDITSEKGDSLKKLYLNSLSILDKLNKSNTETNRSSYRKKHNNYLNANDLAIHYKGNFFYLLLLISSSFSFFILGALRVFNDENFLILAMFMLILLVPTFALDFPYNNMYNLLLCLAVVFCLFSNNHQAFGFAYCVVHLLILNVYVSAIWPLRMEESASASFYTRILGISSPFLSLAIFAILRGKLYDVMYSPSQRSSI